MIRGFLQRSRGVWRVIHPARNVNAPVTTPPMMRDNHGASAGGNTLDVIQAVTAPVMVAAVVDALTLVSIAVHQPGVLFGVAGGIVIGPILN